MMLKEVCSIKMGQSPASDSYNDNGEGVPFFQGNADFGERYPVARKWCSAPMKMAEPEDILISVRAPIGALNYAKEECCIGRGLAALTPNKSKILPEYMFWLLKGKNAELNSKGTGSTFKAIGRKVLEEILVPDIGMKQQMEYAVNLEKINGIIQLRKQELQKLDDLIKSRFVEMFGNETEFDKWPYCTVGDVADVCVGVVIKPTQYYADKGIPAFRSLNIGEMYVKDSDWVYFTEEGHQKNQKSVVHKNDVLVVRSGAPGTACVATEKYDGYNAVDIIIAHPDNSKVNSTFLAAFTNMPHGVNQIRERTGGAAQQHFNVGGYKAMRLIMPSIELQNQFAAFVAQIDKSKLTIQKSLDELETLNKALMQKYFGGNGV